MFTFSSSFMFDFELTRILGSASSGGCDVGEFKSALGNIKKDDPESWYAAWNVQAERAQRIADEAAKAGYRELARNAYLRASNYFRATSYMFSTDDARVVPFTELSIGCFKKATTLMDGEVMCVEIPYEEGIDLPAYLFLPPQYARLPGKIPVVMYAAGADSTKEELYFLYGHTGPQLGYAILCFEGPGQGLVLKKSKIPLRPDFELVAGKVMDFLGNLSESPPTLELDLERIAMAGAATGGYFALRAATDARVRACVSIDPFFSLWELCLSRAPKAFFKLWDSGWVPDGTFDAFSDRHGRGNFQAGWEINLGKSSMGVDRPTAMFRRFKDFTLEPAEGEVPILDRITCPVFLTGPGAGRNMYSSAEDSTLKIHRLLTNVPDNDKEVWVPTDVAEGGLTAKIGAWALLAQKTFEFLDKHFDITRPEL
ncbi:dipeptidyl aminopeptidase/acylaminoacyl peptidase [Colletotrichum salicis]|uniref:Dipeptidyl aminopeptidase/acylaminoacyl peptidase n=1 Tax=Colletotrichum salicis TaxID=1209931 RepID=A0A135UXK1_9PEZI|nr:dipeptidyl aminopeptidase/acylaminoacyl peptidase [Colletotrichum salicis]